MVMWDTRGESRNKSQEIHDRSRIIFYPPKNVEISLNEGGFTICPETVKELKGSKAEETIYTTNMHPSKT